MKSTTAKFWAVELSFGGRGDDLQRWEDALREPFDPWVEFQYLPNTGPPLLRSREFEEMTNAQVHVRAQFMVAVLNGALRVPTQIGRTGIGYIWRQVRDLHDNGIAGNTAKPAAPSPSAAQRWLSYASSNAVAAEMLSHFSNEPNWFDLYKTYEGIRELAGGMSALKSKSWTPSQADITRFTHTANLHRHALPHDAKKNPPKNPMSLADATSMMSKMIHSILDDLNPKFRSQ